MLKMTEMKNLNMLEQMINDQDEKQRKYQV